jgi:hypothetical protein
MRASEISVSLHKMKTSRLIDIMVNRDLYSILRTDDECRNLGLAHGGVVSDKEEEKHLGLLERELTDSKQLAIRFFDQNLRLFCLFRLEIRYYD